MLPLNLNPQLNATSALWANDSTFENITDMKEEKKLYFNQTTWSHLEWFIILEGAVCIQYHRRH